MLGSDAELGKEGAAGPRSGCGRHGGAGVLLSPCPCPARGPRLVAVGTRRCRQGLAATPARVLRGCSFATLQTLISHSSCNLFVFLIFIGAKASGNAAVPEKERDLT